jgi:hypothetical protein
MPYKYTKQNISELIVCDTLKEGGGAPKAKIVAQHAQHDPSLI